MKKTKELIKLVCATLYNVQKFKKSLKSCYSSIKKEKKVFMAYLLVLF